MAQSYTYSVLGRDDVALARGMLQMFGTAFDDHEMYEKHPASDDYLKTRLSDPNCIVMIARAGEQVVGGLIAYVLPKLEQEKSEIYLYDLAVDEKFRMQGIATRLIQELKTEGKKRGAWIIFVQADAVDEPAIKLYESLTDQKEAPFHFDILI